MKVEISVYASKLKNVAGLMKGTSDPFAVLTKVATTPGSKPEVIGKTEVVKNTLDPQWVKVFNVDYELGSPVKVAVSVFDENHKRENAGMGNAVFDIAECLGARGNVQAKKLRNGGTVFLSVRKAQGTGTFRLKLKGTKLKNVEGGLFGKSDPFFELSKKVSSAGGLTWDNVYRSQPVKNNLNPEWETAVIDLSTLCDGELDKPILVSVYDFESSGKHVAMGSFETCVSGLVQAASVLSIPLKQKGKETGTIQVVSAEVLGVEAVTQQMAATSLSSPTPAAAAQAPVVSAPPVAVPVHSTYAPSVVAANSTRVANPAPFAPGLATATPPNFIDYVSGGCELNVSVAIDFTGSNGDPRQPGTLHYLNRGTGERNDYEKAIAAIVSILSKYDSDQMYPVYGFGAKYGGVVRHCFQCGPTAEAKGVQGILDAYHQTFSSGLIMSGPTVITEVMETAAAKATASLEQGMRQGKQTYTILLILTDGAVSDVQATAECLKKISNAPLSIVIVGVGNADFSGMRFLDDCAKNGQRDIAQFVEFNKHSHNSVSLTSETLDEIPNQLVGYFQTRGTAPLPPIQRSDSLLGNLANNAQEAEIDLSLDIREDEIVVTGGGDDFASGFNAGR